MQTFLPFPSFVESARVLDWRRLGKQRVETKQIFLALQADKYGWQNHPAVAQWRGYESSLCLYGSAICFEWRSRDYKDTLLPFFEEQIKLVLPSPFPPWIGDERLHASHRSNLLRKDPTYYGKFGWTEGPDLPYWWPSKEQ